MMVNWILTIDMPPAKTDEYLVTLFDPEIDDEPFTTTRYYSKEGYWYDMDDDEVPDSHIMAWAPLPEPCKGEFISVKEIYDSLGIDFTTNDVFGLLDENGNVFEGWYCKPGTKKNRYKKCD